MENKEFLRLFRQWAVINAVLMGILIITLWAMWLGNAFAPNVVVKPNIQVIQRSTTQQTSQQTAQQTAQPNTQQNNQQSNQQSKIYSLDEANYKTGVPSDFSDTALVIGAEYCGFTRRAVIDLSKAVNTYFVSINPNDKEYVSNAREKYYTPLIKLTNMQGGIPLIVYFYNGHAKCVQLGWGGSSTEGFLDMCRAVPDGKVKVSQRQGYKEYPEEEVMKIFAQ